MFAAGLARADHPDFFIRKAIGWILRNLASVDPGVALALVEGRTVAVLSAVETRGAQERQRPATDSAASRGMIRASAPAWYVAAMAGTKRDRQKALRQARLAREAARARARARRRLVMTLGLGAVVLVAVVAIYLSRRSGTSTVATSTSTSTSTTAAAAGSAAGKPCVPVADPLPANAPDVPVKVGPPPTQLVTEDLKVGTGATVGSNDTVTVTYIGVSCSTGRIFDSSYSRGQTATFPLSGVIKGWTVGIPNMKVGGQRLLGIPPAQAYGVRGQPPTIAPDETLWFVVEVVDTKPT